MIKAIILKHIKRFIYNIIHNYLFLFSNRIYVGSLEKFGYTTVNVETIIR